MPMTIQKSLSETYLAYAPGTLIFISSCLGKKRNCGHSQGYMIFKFVCHCRVPDCSKNFFLLGITKKFFCFAKNIALVVFLGVFSILIMVYDKQFTYYNKLLLPQGNWVDDTTHPSMIFSMHALLESNRTL